MKAKFSTRLRGVDVKGTTTFVLVPREAMSVFAPRRRFPVKAKINGYTYRTTVCDMGLGPCFGVNKAVREATSISRGDRIDVQIELDTEERTVDVPADLAKKLGKRLRAAFDAMSFSYRKEHVLYIEDAKMPQTRKRRLEKVVDDVRKRSAKKGHRS